MKTYHVKSSTQILNEPLYSKQVYDKPYFIIGNSHLDGRGFR